MEKEHRLIELKRSRNDDDDDNEYPISNLTISGASSQLNITEIFTADLKKVKTYFLKSLVEKFRFRLINWIVSYQITLTAVENTAFRDLVYVLSP